MKDINEFFDISEKFFAAKEYPAGIFRGKMSQFYIHC